MNQNITKRACARAKGSHSLCRLEFITHTHKSGLTLLLHKIKLSMTSKKKEENKRIYVCLSVADF